jgi:hypothetical protein
MERRASVQNGIARLGDSTKGLLTFGDDMVHVMQEFSPYRKAKEHSKGLHRIQEDRSRAISSGRVRLSADPEDMSVRVAQSRKSGRKIRSDSIEGYNESSRSVDSVLDRSKPRCASSGRDCLAEDPDDFLIKFVQPQIGGSKYQSDSFGTSNVSPRSVESILGGSKPRASSPGGVRLSADPGDLTVHIVETRVRERKSRSENLSNLEESPRSLAQSKSNNRPSHTYESTFRSAEDKPRGTSATPTRPIPPGRSRPGIRAHRSGSFALRQFKENHQKNHQPVARRHYKTKNEARSKTDQSQPPCEVRSPEKSDWKKPALRLHRSMDGSFCVRSFTSKDTAPCKPPSRHGDICYVPPFSLQDTLQSENEDVFRSHNTIGTGWNENAWERPMIEVAPGFSLPMCGTHETMHALHLDRIVHVECKYCSVFLACINTAYMVLCPGCRSVSPVEAVGYNMSPTLGLGLRVEDILSQIQH